jgi:hypothetical protein
VEYSKIKGGGSACVGVAQRFMKHPVIFAIGRRALLDIYTGTNYVFQIEREFSTKFRNTHTTFKLDTRCKTEEGSGLSVFFIIQMSAPSFKSYREDRVRHSNAIDCRDYAYDNTNYGRSLECMRGSPNRACWKI